MKRLLLIEDEEVIVKALKRLLERNHYLVEVATTVEQAIELHPSAFDLILADLRLPGEQGTHIIPEANPVPVVIMTSHASVRSAVDAMRLGAIDYIAKPFDHDELLLVIERALTQNFLQVQNRALRLDIERMCPAQLHIEGTVIENLLATLSQLKDSAGCVHLFGERGTDKEGVARALHAVSPRRDAPFLIAQITGQSTDKDSALLFGNAGRTSSKTLPVGGYLQAAQNGTLVIRHVERLSHGAQLKLAEALSASTLHSTSSSRPQVINVRVITIGNDRIDSDSQSGHINSELAGLLAAQQFEVPPLRERPRDILPLAMQRLDYLRQRHALPELKLSQEAESALTANQWPGNVAELDSVLTRAAFVCRGSTLSADDLGFNQTTLGARDLSLDEYFRYVVLRNQKELSETELATRLGISRKALWERRQKMQLLRDTRE
jgi:DNA-binding NtrC family response regulator